MNYELGHVNDMYDVREEVCAVTRTASNLCDKAIAVFDGNEADDVVSVRSFGFGKGPKIAAEAMVRYSTSTADESEVGWSWHRNYRATFEDGSVLEFKRFNTALGLCITEAEKYVKNHWCGYSIVDRPADSNDYDRLVQAMVLAVLADGMCRNFRKVSKEICGAYMAKVAPGDGVLRPISAALAAEFEDIPAGLPLVQEWNNPWVIYTHPNRYASKYGIRYAPLAVIPLTNVPLASGYATVGVMAFRKDGAAFNDLCVKSFDMINGKTLGPCLMVTKKVGAASYGRAQCKYSVFLLGADQVGGWISGDFGIATAMFLGGRSTLKGAVGLANSIFAGGLFKASASDTECDACYRQDRGAWLASRILRLTSNPSILYSVQRECLSVDAMRSALADLIKDSILSGRGTNAMALDAIKADVAEFINNRPGNSGMVFPWIK